jgi:lipoprotein-anchoring transpeptidase ErfK/SrfK
MFGLVGSREHRQTLLPNRYPQLTSACLRSVTLAVMDMTNSWSPGRRLLHAGATAMLVAGVTLAGAVTVMPRASADPELNVAGPSEPFAVAAPFASPTISPADGATVGVGKPIVIDFDAPVTDRALAEQAIQISSDPPVPGQFYWMDGSQVRWRPFEFWPAHTIVNVDAGGTRSSFSTGDALIALADNDSHQLTITRNGDVEQTFPMSMGKPGHDTPNGTYYVQDKSLDVVMDSATYGVPNTSPDGYRVHVQLAVRFDNSGNYVHSAPWSEADQGVRNVSHGCINIKPSDAKWFYDNFNVGDPIVVTNSVGAYTQDDGAQDWQI